MFSDFGDSYRIYQACELVNFTAEIFCIQYCQIVDSKNEIEQICEQLVLYSKKRVVFSFFVLFKNGGRL